jgi:hypothetical protein
MTRKMQADTYLDKRAPIDRYSVAGGDGCRNTKESDNEKVNMPSRRNSDLLVGIRPGVEKSCRVHQ